MNLINFILTFKFGTIEKMLNESFVIIIYPEIVMYT